MECFPCINSNKADLQLLADDPARIQEVADLEVEMGITGPRTRNGKIRGALFRPARHMGAVGIREVVRWAHSPRGKYRPPQLDGKIYDEDAAAKEDAAAGAIGCPAGWCGA